ncbi:MAG: phosphatidate cytidylyltransferase [Clostridia bacterium]|nr:phosphatidate cytidylyltransferase [Clostridia bacterium]
MLSRILTAVVGIPLLLAAVFLTSGWGFAIVMAAVCLLIQIELLWNTGLVKSKTVMVAAAVFAAGVPIWCWFDRHETTLVAGLVVFTAVVFFMGMRGRGQFNSIVNVFFSALIVPLMLSSLVGILSEPNGKYLILFPLAIAWLSDTGGYFVGRFFGRHKLCPKISPKKTVEGGIGGVIFATAACAIYCAVLKFICKVEPSWFWMCLLGFLGSPIAQFGDLIFSFIKREQGIKDFGKIMPGHGGFLDRCDSVLLVAPIVWVVMHWLPLVTI